MHNEAHFIPEIIDPETEDVVPEGDLGELVLTALTKEALPLIRDRTRLFCEPCACGRSFARMEKVLGRTDDMILVRGVNVFPSQIESVLLQFDGTEPYYQIFVNRGADKVDDLEIRLEVSDSVRKNPSRVAELERKLSYKINGTLGIRVKIALVPSKTLPRSEGKVQRVVDKRTF